MLQATPAISIPEEELREQFVRASGPGGQNVNKVATAVQLRFDVGGSEALPEEVRRRLASQAASRINEAGELVIDARRYRSRERNREDARQRLAELIRRASVRPRKRRRTRPTAASRKRRLESKRRRGERKRQRKPPRPDES